MTWSAAIRLSPSNGCDRSVFLPIRSLVSPIIVMGLRAILIHVHRHWLFHGPAGGMAFSVDCWRTLQARLSEQDADPPDRQVSGTQPLQCIKKMLEYSRIGWSSVAPGASPQPAVILSLLGLPPDPGPRLTSAAAPGVSFAGRTGTGGGCKVNLGRCSSDAHLPRACRNRTCGDVR